MSWQYSIAQENLAPELKSDEPKPDPNPQPHENSALNLSLDDLFEQLGREVETGKAKAIEKKIWVKWAQSGSATIDLLMGWATIAMKEKNWAAAGDLLDQVVVIAPQYAEGWNRRATMYFLKEEYGHSLHDIEQVLKLESRHFGALAGLANIMQKLNNDARALEMWKNILKLYPANENAQNTVVELEEKLDGRGI